MNQRMFELFLGDSHYMRYTYRAHEGVAELCKNRRDESFQCNMITEYKHLNFRIDFYQSLPGHI